MPPGIFGNFGPIRRRCSVEERVTGTVVTVKLVGFAELGKLCVERIDLLGSRVGVVIPKKPNTPRPRRLLLRWRTSPVSLIR